MTGYLYTDRRRVQTVTALDVPDPVLAQDLASRPLASVDPAVPALEPDPEIKDIEYNIKPLKMHFGEFLRHHATHKDSSDWMKQFKKLLPGVVSDASVLVMGDEPVATFRRDAQLSKSRLEKEQPQIVAKYTKMAWTEVFDEESFKSEMPDVHAAYRGRSFRLVRRGAAAGLVLPS